MPQWRKWNDSNSMKLLHDGATSHKSRIITELLEKNGVQVVNWPGNSPDLNPIVYIWSLLKKKTNFDDENNREQLMASITTVWGKDNGLKEAIKNVLIRCQIVSDVLTVRGGHINY